MSEAKHTKGPWVLSERGISIETSDGSHRQIAVTTKLPSCNQDTTPERMANARLIAAAPDLLTACEAIMSSAVPTENGLYCTVPLRAVRAVQTALAKALEVA